MDPAKLIFASMFFKCNRCPDDPVHGQIHKLSNLDMHDQANNFVDSWITCRFEKQGLTSRYLKQFAHL